VAWKAWKIWPDPNLLINQEILNHRTKFNPNGLKGVKTLLRKVLSGEKGFINSLKTKGII